jgi:hypothetical protein
MDDTADTLTSAVFDELERTIPGAHRDARGGLVLDGDAVMAAARRIDADGQVGYGGDGAAARSDNPDATFWVPERWDFVDPRYLEQGGNRYSDNAPLLDFLPAPTLAAVAGDLLERYRGKFHHLFPPFKQKVDFLWKRQGGESAGRATLGMCVKVGTLAKHYASLTIPDATWAIWVAADNCALITNRQIRGLLLHELCHTGMNEKLKPKLVGHDVEEFRFVIEEFGFIFDDLRKLKASVLQRSLFEGGEGRDDDQEEA